MQVLKTVSPIKGFLLATGILAGLLLSAAGCSLLMPGADRPLDDEFGLGPRASAQGTFSATLVPGEPIKLRKLQTLQVALADASGAPVEGATLAIDGGMPQHGHGLPTRPRVTAYLGEGVYEIEGVRFNMGGWWEFEVAIATTAGSDTVTFNLDL